MKVSCRGTRADRLVFWLIFALLPERGASCTCCGRPYDCRFSRIRFRNELKFATSASENPSKS